MKSVSNLGNSGSRAHLSRSASWQAMGVALFVAAGAAQASAATAASDAADAAVTAAATPDDQVQAVVVTGIRASIERSIKTKRDDQGVVEALSAEDIGKLPDTSIAESIARLPGLTAQRLNGRDQVISIRGFGPDFSTALLNGREQVTTGNNRGVEYDQYPSELVSSVVVDKTPNASLVGSGMVGTVELNTIRPLSSPRVASFQARTESDGYKALNPGADDTGYRLSGIYSDKFANDTVGVMLGVARQSSPTQDKNFNSWGYPTDSNGNLIIGGSKSYGESLVLERTGFVGTIEYQPNDNFHTSFDTFISDFKETDYLRGIEFPLAWGGGVTTSNIVSSGGIDTSATFNNVHAVQRNDYNQRKAQTLSLGWNTKFKVTDGINATTDLSYSRAKRGDFLMENYTGVGYNGAGPGDTVTATRNSNGTYNIHTTLNYSDPSVFKITDPNGWGGNYLGTPVVQAGYLNKPYFTDELTAARFDLDGGLNKWGFKSWKTGINYSVRTKTSDFTAFFMTLPNGATSAPVPQAAILGTANPLGFLGVGPTLAYDPLYLYNHVYQPLADLRPVSLTDDYRVREKVAVAYAMLNVDSQFLNYPMTGNVGFQIVSTDQSSTGKSASTPTPTTVVVVPISGSDTYVDFLPSTNLKFDVAPDTDVRFGLARTLSRPRLDQEEITSTINTNLTNLTLKNPAIGQSYFSASGGNIHLHPYISDGVDLTLERYFGNSGYISLQGYYKHLTQYVNPSLSHLQDFSAAVSSFLTPAQAAQLGTTQGLVSAPGNSGRGSVLGLEMAASVPFKLFTPMLNGFGVEASASVTDSEIKYEPTDKSYLPIEGLSKWVTNTTFYYEKDGFQARISARYRSHFLGEVSGLSASRVFQDVKAETLVDAQIGYTVQNGPLKNLAILLQGKNLTDQEFVTYANRDPRQVINYQKYGPTYLLGLSYKY